MSEVNSYKTLATLLSVDTETKPGMVYLHYMPTHGKKKGEETKRSCGVQVLGEAVVTQLKTLAAGTEITVLTVKEGNYHNLGNVALGFDPEQVEKVKKAEAYAANRGGFNKGGSTYSENAPAARGQVFGIAADIAIALGKVTENGLDVDFMRSIKGSIEALQKEFQQTAQTTKTDTTQNTNTAVDVTTVQSLKKETVDVSTGEIVELNDPAPTDNSAELAGAMQAFN